MTEHWLAPNRRALTAALVPAGGLVAAGVAAALAFEPLLMRLAGGALAAGGLVAVIGLVSQLVRPRIGYRDGLVVFNLRAGAGIATPVEIVEAFFLGQGPAHVPSLRGETGESVNLVARLSQKAPQWADVEVKPALGRWHGGYVTIRGAWCEPLNNDVIRRLNRRLREAREARAAESAPARPSAAGTEAAP
ncbi:MAG: hypothetical protein DCC67_02795 [Planctomycetota bacterium]|nr:MAG: hypothetical protein DCC67_02795 [Planctomycetota bacterium]